MPINLLFTELHRFFTKENKTKEIYQCNEEKPLQKLFTTLAVLFKIFLFLCKNINICLHLILKNVHSVSIRCFVKITLLLLKLNWEWLHLLALFFNML